MRDLMKTNVYDIEEKIVIIGSCLEKMQPNAFSELKKLKYDMFELCLEDTHINMAITKLAGMLARKNIKNIIFASVDKSPHCVQLQYIENEIRKIMNIDDTIIEHYVAVDDKLIKIDKNQNKRV